MMAFCPEHPKWDQNPKFTPLSEGTSIPTPYAQLPPRETYALMGGVDIWEYHPLLTQAIDQMEKMMV